MVNEEAEASGVRGLGAERSGAERGADTGAARQDSGGRSWEAGGDGGVGGRKGRRGAGYVTVVPTCWSQTAPNHRCSTWFLSGAPLVPLSICRLVYDMNDKQDRPYVCGAPGCSQRFQLEEHLLIHRHKHEMTLKFPPIKTDITFSDQTPTPTRFLQNCEEVGLFKEIEEEFLQAQEEENNKQALSHNGPPCMNQHYLKAQLQLQHSPQPQLTHPQPPLNHPQPPLHHPQGHGPMMAPSCSLVAQQGLSSSSAASQSGSVITLAPSTLTHSG
ncbi:hypothetical protein ATANTOWER_000125 [Ataeniobius toweri]|uniref:C2H2-type domain-containing protein n=1 Tax=Ataeniobius toweri TaxID=208326 RepID=A0ABU7BNB3_9TELE|nr:hypothetical protein [Ataeniobius toweri]